ncbi:MAG: MFS transporter [Rhizobiaceae bacterium]
MTTETVIDPNASARRNALILAAAQALCGAAAPISIALGGLAGIYLLGADKSLATAPVTGYNLGIALAAIPAAMLMARIGRRLGFISGAVVGIIGMLVSSYAIYTGSFAIFCVGMLLSGCGSSFTQQYRFAAADQGTADFKPKAISWVLAGGIFAGVIGPQTAINFRDMFAPIEFAGAYFAGSFLLLAGIIVLSFLKFDAPATKQERNNEDTGRPLSQIIKQPKFIVAVLCAVGSYALMTFVMTGAPLAMMVTGYTPDDSTWGIQWHVLAMFGPSFFTGNLIARFGKMRIIAIGLALLGLCAVVALQGIALTNFYGALILLGIGWNFGFIGATTLLTETYQPEERAKAQGANDFILFSMTAFASFMAGQTLNAYGAAGWNAINMVVFPVITICLLGLLWLKFQTKHEAA